MHDIRNGNFHLPYFEQVSGCTSSLPPVSTLEDLYIFEDRVNPLSWQDDVEITLWLPVENLRPFAPVKNLYPCNEFVPRIAPALQEFVGVITTEEVLPTLENIFLEGCQPSESLHEGIEKFVVAQQLTRHPIAVSRWHKVYDWSLMVITHHFLSLKRFRKFLPLRLIVEIK